MSDERIVERRNNTKWEKIIFPELRKNDIFRLFEPDNGHIVIGHNNSSVFIAETDSFVNEDGHWSIMTR